MQTCTEMWGSKPCSRSNKHLPLSYPANNVLMATEMHHIWGQTLKCCWFRKNFTVTYSASAALRLTREEPTHGALLERQSKVYQNPPLQSHFLKVIFKDSLSWYSE